LPGIALGGSATRTIDHVTFRLFYGHSGTGRLFEASYCGERIMLGLNPKLADLGKMIDRVAERGPKLCALSA